MFAHLKQAVLACLISTNYSVPNASPKYLRFEIDRRFSWLILTRIFALLTLGYREHPCPPLLNRLLYETCIFFFCSMYINVFYQLKNSLDNQRRFELYLYSNYSMQTFRVTHYYLTRSLIRITTFSKSDILEEVME